MKPLDLTGRVFGLLTVVERVSPPKKDMSPGYRNQTWWRLTCECGSKKKVIKPRQNLTSGEVRSCGCLKTGPVPSAAKVVSDRKGRAHIAKAESLLREKRQRAADAHRREERPLKW